jgi:hypothetical protein
MPQIRMVAYPANALASIADRATAAENVAQFTQIAAGHRARFTSVPIPADWE